MKYELIEFEDNISLEFEEIKMDYLIRYDITGRIIKFHPILFDLPENAQKIILGKNLEEAKTKILNYGQLLQIILPLGINYQSTFYSKELGHVYNKINTELDRLKIEIKDLLVTSERLSIRQLLHAAHNPELLSEMELLRWKEYLVNLIKVLKSPNSNGGYVGLLGNMNPIFGFLLVPLFIPILNEPSHRSTAYASLSRNTDEECFKYLRQEFLKTNDPQDLQGILSALSDQKYRTSKIEQKLISIYHSGIKLSEFGYSNLVKLLGDYSSEEAAGIVLEFAKKNLNPSSKEAITVLFNTGYPPKKIAKIVMDKLNSKDVKAHKVAYLQIGNCEALFDYYPNCIELIGHFKKSLELKVNPDSAQSLSMIINYKYKKRIFGKSKIINLIITNIYTENTIQKEGFLSLIDSLIMQKSFNYKNFSSRKLIQKYFVLLDNENYAIQRRANSILERIGMNNRDKKILNSFIDRLDTGLPRPNLILRLEAIKSLLSKVKYNHYLTPILLNYAEDKDSSLRAIALEILKYSNDNEMKKKLMYLKDDPDYRVQRAVKNLLKT